MSIISFSTSKEVRKEIITALWQGAGEEEMAREIAERFSISSAEIQDLLTILNESGYDQANTVSLFYNDGKWLEKEPCFDYRIDGQILPRQSVVYGYISRKGGGIVDPPYLSTAEQEEDFKKNILSALCVLGLICHRLVKKNDDGYELWMVEEEK